jgi:ribosome-associated toxin RatA of RatAB toxin-antitoxin module
MAAVQPSGGRASARQFVFLMIATLILSAPAPHARGMTDEAPSQVSVREENRVYLVRACFDVPQAPSVALDVLTDYEQIPRFMPEVKSSVVRERSADRIVVEQEAVARMMMFSKRVFLRLEVRRTDDTVSFRDSWAKSFSTYEGAWHVTRENGRTRVRYDLRAAPAFDVPGFLLTRLLKRDATTMIGRLRTEIATRGQ